MIRSHIRNFINNNVLFIFDDERIEDLPLDYPLSFPDSELIEFLNTRRILVEKGCEQEENYTVCDWFLMTGNQWFGYMIITVEKDDHVTRYTASLQINSYYILYEILFSPMGLLYFYISSYTNIWFLKLITAFFAIAFPLSAWLMYRKSRTAFEHMKSLVERTFQEKKAGKI